MRKMNVSLMFLGILTVVLFVSTSQDSEAARKNKVINGTISNFDCEQDICLLTIVDGKGEEHEGLLSDPRYDKWNQDSKMPADFKGKKVKVTVVESQGGHGRGSSDSFIKIEVLK